MKKILYLFIFLVSIGVSAQKIKGVVIDSETKEPIEHAHIQIKDKVILTNKKGEFSFRAPKKWDNNFYITHLSYQNKKLRFSNSKEFSVSLKRQNTLLNEVVVVGEKGQNKLQFEELPEMPKRLYSFASVKKDDKIYVFGGDKTFSQRGYERMLRRMGSLPLDQFQQQGFMPGRITGVVNPLFLDPLFIPINYMGFNDEVLVYDIHKKKWTQEDIKLRKRANHSAVAVGDKIYIMGGKRLSTNRRKEYLDSKVEVFDLNSNSVKVDDTNPHRAVDMEIINYKGKLYTFGGTVKENVHGKKHFTQKVHSYNPETGDWFLLAEVPISEDTTTMLLDDTVYFFGGFKKQRTNMIVSVNLVTGVMKSEGKLFHDFKKPAVAKKGKTIFIFENRKLLTFDTENKILKEYLVDLPLVSSEIFIEGNNLLVLGGVRTGNFSLEPQREFYKIDLSQLSKTRARKYAKL
jgi:hypothetical protein